jgi:hypothetical protein
MRLLLLLLAPVFGYSQPNINLTYHVKEVHTIGWRSDTTTFSWRIDTIKYGVPFEIKLTSKSVVVDGYGTFKVDSVKQKYNSPYWNYWLNGGKQFALIENEGFLNYPIINKKSQIIIFYIDSQ